VANDLQIDKISDKEIRILLGSNSQVTTDPVTAEDLYEQLGRYLQNTKNPVTADCGVDY
jgi:hypothetical protein